MYGDNFVDEAIRVNIGTQRSFHRHGENISHVRNMRLARNAAQNRRLLETQISEVERFLRSEKSADWFEFTYVFMNF